MMPSIRRGVHAVRRGWHLAASLGRVAIGAGYYQISGKTPPPANAAFRHLHFATNGHFNDWAHAVVRAFRPPRKVDPRGVLGDLDEGRLARILAALRRDGFYRFDTLLPEETCRAMEHFALTAEGEPFPKKPDLPERLRYDPTKPQAEGYYFMTSHAGQPLLRLPEVQRLIADQSLLAVAQEYLGCLPTLDHAIVMWWSTVYRSGEPCSEMAQLFHTDMARIKFIKFFFYLTDVTPETGPLTYVRGSHRRKPKGGYSQDRRYSDEEILRVYSKNDIVELTGPRGTILAADTRGFHKGKPPRSGHRLNFQIEFADCLFGAPYYPVEADFDPLPELRAAVVKYPKVYGTIFQPSAVT